MLYVIGGVPRTGKSTLSLKLAERVPMPCVPTDLVRSMLNEVAPQLGVHPGDPYLQRRVAFQPYVMSMCRKLLAYWNEAAVEGDEVVPQYVETLRSEGHEVRAVFLGRTNVDMVSLLEWAGPNDWIRRPAEGYESLTHLLHDWDAEVRADCKRLSLPYVDMSDGTFQAQQQRSLDILLDN